VNPDGHLEATNNGTPGGIPLAPPRPTGSRTHALAALSWPYSTPGWTFVPKLSLNAAAYSLDRPLTTGDQTGKTEFSRVIPSASVDTSWVLERDASWFGRSIRQTLEPRVLYVNTPYRAQKGLPLFDTAVKDFNVDSIYTDNTFSGVDRVSDSNQLTTGITTRVLDPVTGAEDFRLGIAQRLLFENQSVTPEDGPPITQSLSDVLVFGSSNLSRRWYLDAAVQYSHELRRTVRSVVGARYTTSSFRTVSVAYRLKESEPRSRQVDVAWQWPLYRGKPGPGNAACSGGWYSAGSLKYSLLESRLTDSMVAMEYDSGCWIGRVMVRRQSLSLNEASTVLGLQLEFVGFTRLGLHNPLKYLKDNIPGYRPLRDDESSRVTP
jgi:LPS-assembly protein